MTDDPPIDPIDAFAEISSIRLSDTPLEGVLGRIADAGRRSIPGAAAVSVTLIRDETPHTAAFSGALAPELDEAQYEQGHGPCLSAAASGETVTLPDMRAETRWPDLARRALGAGCHSSLSIGMPVQPGVAGALNVYAPAPEAFDDDAVGIAQTFAGYAAVALANAHLYDVTATLTRHLQQAMASRAVIEQAKGILMGERHCTAEEAARILARLAEEGDHKLRDVATALVAQATQG